MWRYLILSFALLVLAAGQASSDRRAELLRNRGGGSSRGALLAARRSGADRRGGDQTSGRRTPSRIAQRPRTTTTSTTTTTAAPSSTDYDTECPEKYGYFADAFQCDRYYECHNYQITEHICPDGLVFNDYSIDYGRCDYMHSINCTGREQLQEPKPSGDCPRQNGYYPDEDPRVCDKFVHCVDGEANRLTCPAGLVFSLNTGTCQWPDQAGRTGCTSEEVLDFKCPDAAAGKIENPSPGQLIHPRYADPSDCQYFFSCIDGVVPRRHGCELGRVFNDVTKQCDVAKNVPECVDWYVGILDYDEDGNIKG